MTLRQVEDDTPKETEREKVARLRALARKTREAEERRQRERGAQ